MAGPAFNPTKHIQRQGIDPKITYSAIVINNEDKSFRGRVQARVLGLMDGIDDANLPWAIPSNNFVAFYEGPAKRGGSFAVPDVGAKIGLRFPLGDPHRPVQCAHPQDDVIMLDEAKTNYPFRKVLRFANGFYIIVDTKTNEVFLHNPGDLHFTIFGDVTQTIVGRQTITVTGSDGDVPAYLLNAPDTKMKQIAAKSAGNVKFAGLLGSSKGSQHTEIKGDQTVKIKGNRKVIVEGNDELVVKKNRTEQITGNHQIKSMRSDTN